jgi:hypothetical protein
LARVRELATGVEVTERARASIAADLEGAGYLTSAYDLTRSPVGRRAPLGKSSSQLTQAACRAPEIITE